MLPESLVPDWRTSLNHFMLRYEDLMEAALARSRGKTDQAPLLVMRNSRLHEIQTLPAGSNRCGGPMCHGTDVVP